MDFKWSFINFSKEMKETTSSEQKSTPIWLGFGEKRFTSRGTVKIRLRWRRLFVLCLVLAVLGWMGKSVALYYFFKEVREYEEIGFVDTLLFPLNRKDVRRQQGDYQIKQGEKAVEEGKFREAFSLMREGLSRSPANLEGRLNLARLYVGWRPDLALQLLEDGLSDGREDIDYVRLYLTLLIRQKEDSTLFSVTKNLLDDPDLPQEIHRLAATNRMQLAIRHGKFKMAEESFKQGELQKSADGILLGSELYIRKGEQEKATALLEMVINRFRQRDDNLSTIYEKLIASYKKIGELDKARQTALEYSIRTPMEWRPRILLVEILGRSDREQRKTREINAMLQDHRNDEQAMLALGEYCANNGEHETASRLYNLALENNYNLALFSLILIESQVTAHNYEAAVALCNELLNEKPDWLDNYEGLFNGLRSIAYFGLGNPELGEMYLKNFKDARNTSSSQLLQAANRFKERGWTEYAMELYEEAYLRENKNHIALSQLIETQMEIGSTYQLAQRLKELPELRRPEYALIQQIQQSLTSDRFLFTEDRKALIQQLESMFAERNQEIDLWGQNPAASSES